MVWTGLGTAEYSVELKSGKGRWASARPAECRAQGRKAPSRHFRSARRPAGVNSMAPGPPEMQRRRLHALALHTINKNTAGTFMGALHGQTLGTSPKCSKFMRGAHAPKLEPPAWPMWMQMASRMAAKGSRKTGGSRTVGGRPQPPRDVAASNTDPLSRNEVKTIASARTLNWTPNSTMPIQERASASKRLNPLRRQWAFKLGLCRISGFG